MMWCHYSPEWFDSSSNFPNCAVRILDSAIPGWDGGGLFGGYTTRYVDQIYIHLCIIFRLW
jgi:hypothetical protein